MPLANGNVVYYGFMALAALCLFAVLIGCVILLFTKKSGAVMVIMQRRFFLYADIVISLAGLAISCAFDPQMRNVWIFLLVLAVLNFVLAVRK